MNKLVKNLLLLCLIVILSPLYAFGENELYKAGVVSYNQGKYDQALKFLSSAVKEAPQDIKSLYYFANTLVKTHNYDYAKKYYERIVQLSPESDYANYSQVALRDLALKDASIEQPIDSLYVNDSQLFNSDNSYIANIIQTGKIIHWDTEKMPLKVYITPSKYPEYNKFVWDAFNDWASLSRGVVFFVKTDLEEEANIIVKWGDRFEDDADDDLFGYSVPLIEGSNLLNYTIYLLNKDYNSEILLPNYIYTNALHQIGHSLGINAHSSNPGDLMYVDGNYGEVTRRDISTLNLLYQMIPDFSNFVDLVPVQKNEEIKKPDKEKEKIE